FSACKALTRISAPRSSRGFWPEEAAAAEASSALEMSMINLSRISLTKNLGCSSAHPREAASELETSGHGRDAYPPDRDPFACDDASPGLWHCSKTARSLFVGAHGNATIPPFP